MTPVEAMLLHRLVLTTLEGFAPPGKRGSLVLGIGMGIDLVVRDPLAANRFREMMRVMRQTADIPDDDVEAEVRRIEEVMNT